MDFSWEKPRVIKKTPGTHVRGVYPDMESSELARRRHACMAVALHAAMVAKVPCNLTPRRPPSQVVDNLPQYGR